MQKTEYEEKIRDRDNILHDERILKANYVTYFPLELSFL